MRTIRRTLAEIDVEGKLLPDGTFCVYVTSDAPVFFLIVVVRNEKNIYFYQY